LGRHSNEGWICDDCFRCHASKKESHLAAKDIQQQQHEKMEPVKASDVSPNTPQGG
jgi:hypothetical protein